MNENWENKKYDTLDDDNDVVLLGHDTFTVGRFKQLASLKFGENFTKSYVVTESYHRSISSLMSNLPINEGTIIPGGDINWSSPQEGIDCQILKIGAKGWQKGKVKIEVNKNLKSGGTQTCIKFCPDEPVEQKSPLDDIRQSEEYKKLSNNK
ncbi:KGK family protein [Microcoleus vaginatus DQ-U2]|uniref:KGK domain-containing protein n=1 Tax=Microcoleus vaginatus TaxID=119532 RepID=UPI00168672D9|nr:KGK family protein [Microcoleus sp. FACHB-DQ6]